MTCSAGLSEGDDEDATAGAAGGLRALGRSIDTDLLPLSSELSDSSLMGSSFLLGYEGTACQFRKR